MQELTEDNYTEFLNAIWLAVKGMKFSSPSAAQVFIAEHEANLDYYLLLSQSVPEQFLENDPSRVHPFGGKSGAPGSHLEDDKAFRSLIKFVVEWMERFDLEPPIGDISATFTADMLKMLIKKIQQMNGDEFQEHDFSFKVDGVEYRTSDQAAINNSLTISEAWETYKEDKLQSGSWKDAKAIDTKSSEIADFIEVLGEDYPVAALTRNHANTFRADIQQFPKHRQQKFKGVPLAEISSDVESIAASTASQRLSRVNAFFDFLVKNEYVEKNVFDGLEIKSNEVSYATYTKDDIRELFNLDDKYLNKPWKFWIPRIALYTGARLNEIAQLTVKDIVHDKNSDIHYFSINDQDNKKVKTDAAIRKVPISSQLINNGFLDYVKQIRSAGSTSLWPDIASNKDTGKAVSKYWTGLKKKNILSQPVGEKGGKKVFHSLRRVFINSVLKKDKMIPKVQALVGHEPSMLGETKTYMDEIASLAELKDIVESFDQYNDVVSWDTI